MRSMWTGPLRVALVMLVAVLVQAPATGAIRVATESAGTASAPRAKGVTWFRVDAQGSVWWIDGFGRIRKDSEDTGWQPDSNKPTFTLDEAGNVYFVDSFGNLHKDDTAFNAKPEEGAYGYDAQGHTYWIDSFWHHLMRDGEDLGYVASWQSPIKADGEGNVYYVNPETRTLWRNGDDLGLSLFGMTFWVSRDGGKVYYWTYFSQVQSGIWEYTVADHQNKLIDYGTMPPFIKLDGRGDLYYNGPWGMLKRNGMALGITLYGDYRLDGSGHVYYVRNGHVWRDTADLGFQTTGPFDVTPSGAVYHVVDETWGTLDRDGVSTGVSLR